MDFVWVICLWAAPFLISLTAGQDEPLTFSVQILGSTGPREVKAGETGSFLCEATEDESGTAPDLAWFVDDVLVDKTTATSGDATVPYIKKRSSTQIALYFDEFTEKATSVLKCTGTINGQTASETLELRVITKLEILSDKNQYGFLGEEGVLECRTSGSSLKEWMFEDGTAIQASDRYVMDQDTLSIKDLTFDDTRVYKCNADDFQSNQRDLISIDFQVVEKPTIPSLPTIQPNNPKVGDEVKIYCTANGTPKPTFQFKRGQNTLSNSEEEFVDESNGILTLRSITSDSEGKYTCIASNLGGTVEATTTLDVKIPPTIEPIGNVETASESETRDIKCTAEGDPAPSLIWQKIGEAAISSTESGEGPHVIDEASTEPDDAKIKRVSKILRFTSVRPSDAGQYMCKAINNAGTVNVTIDFDVTYAPHFDTNYEQTEFYGWRSHTANLTCMASANGLANFRWYIPSAESPDDVTMATQLANKAPYSIMTEQKFPDFHLSSSSLLVTLGDDESLYRDYMCEADNGQSATRIVTLKKATAPAQPGLNVIATHSTHVQVEVTKPTDNGGQPVTSYGYKYYSNNDPNNAIEGVLDGDDIRGDKTVFTIKNLQPSTSYVIEVQAGNIVDNSAYSQLPFETQEVSEPSRITITSPKTSLDAKSYKLTWAQPENNGSPITAYHVTWQKVSVADESAPDLSIADYVVGTKKEETIEDNLDRLEFTITGLDSRSYYNVEILAKNDVGNGSPGVRTIKTPAGAEDGMEEEGGNDKETPEPNKDGKEQASTNPAAAGLSSAIVIAIIIGIIILLLVIVLIIYLIAKKRRQNSEANGGEEEGGAKEAGKDQAEEEKLIKKNDTLQTENETGGDGEVPAVPISQPEEYEPDTKPDVNKETEVTPPVEDTTVADTTPAEQPQDEKPAEPAADPTPAPAPEVKVTGTPEDTDKMDAPTA